MGFWKSFKMASGVGAGVVVGITIGEVMLKGVEELIDATTPMLEKLDKKLWEKDIEFLNKYAQKKKEAESTEEEES